MGIFEKNNKREQEAERKRLPKKDTAAIEAAFQKLHGIKTYVRNYQVLLYRNNRYIGSVRWIAKEGWEPVFVQPFLCSYHDLDLAVAELALTLKIQGDAKESWTDYIRRKSHKTWNHYVGILATYYARIFQPEEEK